MIGATEQEKLNERFIDLGSLYWERMQGEIASLFDRQYWQGQILDWITSDEFFKVEAFRFVDVLPALHSTAAIASHVHDYLLRKERKLPVAVRTDFSMALARLFKVGNLYINLGCTGALVGRQPFGVFGMNGVGTKAGGPGYLLHFANPRCITENSIRSGFTPDFQL